jgi:hypothetical protein
MQDIFDVTVEEAAYATMPHTHCRVDAEDYDDSDDSDD